MNRKDYERMKQIASRISNGTATFAERNIFNMEAKRNKGKGHSYAALRDQSSLKRH